MAKQQKKKQRRKKQKRKLTSAERAAKKRRREEFETIFVHGKMKRVRRPPNIDGIGVGEFIRRNADPIWLHQNEMWELIEDESREPDDAPQPAPVSPRTPPGDEASSPFTRLQGQYLAFIHTYTKLHRFPPAEADMQRHFGVTPPSVHRMVMTLARDGFITRGPAQARSIRVQMPPEQLPELE